MEHPKLVQVSRSVHAWIGANGDSNAGAIVTPRGVVVIDTQQLPSLARRFRAAIDEAIAAPPCLVVNTHAHLDHIAGNALFKDVPVLAHEKAAAALDAVFGPAARSDLTLSGFEATARLLWGNTLFDLVAEDDPQRDWFRQQISAPEYATIPIVPPDQTFADRFDVIMPDDVISMAYHGPAHSEGDITVHIQGEKVIFLSDLMFYRRFPWMGDCDLNGWIDRLTTILALDVDVVIPGHGPPTDLSEVQRFRQLFIDLRLRVEAAIRAKTSEEAAMREIHLPDHAHLPRYDQWRAINVKAAYRALKGSA